MLGLNLFGADLGNSSIASTISSSPSFVSVISGFETELVDGRLPRSPPSLENLLLKIELLGLVVVASVVTVSFCLVVTPTGDDLTSSDLVSVVSWRARVGRAEGAGVVVSATPTTPGLSL